MHQVAKSVLVPHAAARMFALVDDVEAYPEFLPWCAGAKVLAREGDTKTARIDIDFHGVKAHFTTDNRNTPPSSILIRLKDGPFEALHGEWRFKALAEQACKVEFTLAWQFKTQVIEALIGPVFNRIATTFIEAFVRRADTLGVGDKSGNEPA